MAFGLRAKVESGILFQPPRPPKKIMAKCDYCNSTIIFGGVRNGEMRFCNDRCYRSGFLLTASQHLPTDLVAQQIETVHQGLCPKCHGSGPVDVHTSYQVFSALLFTRWCTKPQVSCRSCGVKSQLGNLMISLFFGWWGIPWGLIFTPIQVTRNLIGIASPPNPAAPTPQLERLVRITLASKLAAEAKAAQAAQSPQTPPKLS